jgi:hypothetical protein
MTLPIGAAASASEMAAKRVAAHRIERRTFFIRRGKPLNAPWIAGTPLLTSSHGKRRFQQPGIQTTIPLHLYREDGGEV